MLTISAGGTTNALKLHADAANKHKNNTYKYNAALEA